MLNSPALALARELKGIRPGRMPDFIGPQLATLWGKPPSGERWIHEIKYDGYRVQLHVSDAGVRYYTRRGHDWSAKFGTPLAVAASEIKTHAAVIDGELVALSEDGRPDFGVLQADLGTGRTDRLVFYAFDLLYLDGLDLRGAALIDRKRALLTLLNGVKGPVKFSEHLEGDAASIARHACALNYEGIVSKLKDAPYASRRTEDWVKVTCRKRDTFPIVGSR